MLKITKEMFFLKLKYKKKSCQKNKNNMFGYKEEGEME